MLDNIQAKMNNLVDNTDDINNFEKAYVYLENLAKSIKAKRGSGGRIDQIIDHQARLNEQLEDCDNTEVALNHQLQLMLEQEKRLKELKEIQIQLDAQKNNIVLVSKKQEYDKLLKQKEEIQKKLSTIESIINGQT